MSILLLLPQEIIAETHILDIDSTDIAVETQKECQFKSEKLILPLSFLAMGVVGLCELPPIDNVSKSIHSEVTKHNFHTKVDDYIRFVPTAAHLGLGKLGVATKHGFVDRTIAAATANATMVILTQSIKYTVREMRPDGSTRNSFPSGHTATAFTGAELVRLEYGGKYGIAAYSVAVATGIMRIANDRHWFHDVVGGAGIGILSANIGYWMLPVWKRVFHLERSERSVSLAPWGVYNDRFGITAYIKL